ncbi:MAG: hypothetical protein ACPGUU_10125 [Flavobacteriaceae bacterium]
MRRKLVVLSICFLSVLTINAQCLSGDCENGYGIYKYQGEIYRSGYWKNGDGTGIELLVTKNYRAFNNKVNGKVQISYYKQGPRIIVGHGLTKTGFIINLQEGTFEDATFNDNFKMVTKAPLKNNNVYEGCVAGDCENGIGVYKDPYSYLVATFKNGKANGFGYYHLLALKQTYVGEFTNDKKNGTGIYYYKLFNDFYMGQWNNDKPNGKGVRHTTIAKYKEGTFKDGKLVIN